MSNEEIARKLEEFQEYLSISNIFTDIVRWLGWVFIKGLAWIVDMLENVTDDILLVKSFYNNPEIVAFVDSIKPVLYILLAFSLLNTGYLLIFQKKFNREGIAINLFIALMVILALNASMDKADAFTDVAIDAVKVNSLYPTDESSVSSSIIHRNVVDLTEVDKSNWSSTELTVPNSTPPNKIININVREKYGKDTEDISSEGKDISKYTLSFNNAGEYRAEKLDQSGLGWNNEYYFRYSINWFTIFVTLGVIAFTLFSISLKLAKLFFELTFNYILALIVAPADIHDGQKTKKIIQAILNTFFATFLIFLSMKVYMIGTTYLEETLDTFPYLIALIAFSLAVIDGPNIVEKLFGIDAGLKNGWGVLAGAYAGSKLISKTGKFAAESADFMTGGKLSDAKNQFGNRNRKGVSNTKAPSPNASTKEGFQANTSNPTDVNDDSKNVSSSNVSNQTDDSVETSQSPVSKSIDSQLEEEQTQGERKQHRAPSPNDAERGLSEQSRTHIGEAGRMSSQQPSKDAMVSGVSEQRQGSETLANNVPTVGSLTKSSTEGNAQSSIEGSHSSQKVHAKQRSSVQTNIDVTNEIDQSTTMSSRTVQTSSVSAVQDNTTNTHTVTNQQNVQHTDQVNVQTAQQTSYRTVTGQETQQHAPAPTIKRRPSSYQIPSTVNIQKLKSRT
ncbi:hypothetical protein V7198_18430 [Bacillus pumilus]|uniref:pLS20_p028 family conjugation system transmembrane protein n=1 Tax=Bacillus pumilus TaxID=1408 RepID=UPI002E2466FB|nr:hypothetical protein [Bacillus pumilus]